jgi:hypothetical protein
VDLAFRLLTWPSAVSVVESGKVSSPGDSVRAAATRVPSSALLGGRYLASTAEHLQD